MRCTEAIKKIKHKGWSLSRTKGSHYHFKHPYIKGLITIPFHGARELSPAVFQNIRKITGIS